MKEELITFETAKLAKEKGFDWKCLNYWGINYILELTPELNASFNRHPSNYNGEEFTDQSYSAPTQALLQKWLREKHVYVEIEIDKTSNPKFCYALTRYQDYECVNLLIPRRRSDLYYTYEEALEAGLKAALLELQTPSPNDHK